jgi:hypothetical protein
MKTEELDNLIEHKNMINFIRAQRLRWLGHVERIPEERDVTNIYKWKLIASSPVGRQKIGWMDNVMQEFTLPDRLPEGLAATACEPLNRRK